MKPGYILLEIIISIALGALVLAGIFGGFFQVNNGYMRANRIVDIDTRVCVIQQQFDRDFSGAFVPFVAESQKKTTTATQPEGAAKKLSAPGQKKEEEAEKKQVPLKKAFFSQERGDNLEQISCITSNPFASYGKPRPRVARVVYSLVPEKGTTGQDASFSLVRKEMEELSVEEQALQVQGGHELAGGIKNLSLEYIVRPKEKKEEPTQDVAKKPEQQQEKKTTQHQEGQEKKKPEYKTFKTWTEEQIKEVNRPLPNFVVMNLSLWDNAKKRAEKFAFKIAIVADYSEPKPKKKQAPSTKRQPGKKPQPPRGGARRPAGGRSVPPRGRARRPGQAAVARARGQSPKRALNLRRPKASSTSVASTQRRRR